MSPEAVRISKDAQVLRFFASKRGRIDATAHLKLAYLADLCAREYLGRPITGFSYRWHNHGPFDSAFYSAREELVTQGLAQEHTTTYPGVDYTGRTLVNLPGRVKSDLTAGERMVLEYVNTHYGDLPLDGLLKIVYETEPMQMVEKRGQRLPMDEVNDRGREDLGVDLDELASAQERVRAGEYLTLNELVGELRSTVRL